MKLLFLTGSRGEWGYIRPILRLCKQQNIQYQICATNMHLLAGNGLSIQDIKADGFEVSDEIDMALEGHNHFTMTKSLGVLLLSFADLIKRTQPNWLVLAGDRGEQLMGAIAGAYTYVPVAHIQAGELSGNIDGLARHAIGKFAHLHFASNLDAAQRLLKLGEEEFRIKMVGAPQLDEIVRDEVTPRDYLTQKFNIDFSKPYILVCQHSVTEEFDQIASQIQCTVDVLNSVKMQKIWIFPNNDAGCDVIRDNILKNRKSDTYIFENLKREDYLGIMKYAQCMIGNSSAGLLEAPTFKLPVVNLGRRQLNRVRGQNVIDSPFEKDEVIASLRKACSPEFRDSIKDMENPYGDGRSAERILEILQNTPINANLLSKKLTY